MIKQILSLGLALGFVLGSGSLVSAEEYNTRRPYLPPSGQVKINNARAKMFVIQNELDEKRKEAEEAGKQGCPEGVFVDRSNPRREVIIATKDIVNLGGQLDLSVNVTAVDRRHEVLGAVLDPLHRLAEVDAGQRHEDVLGVNRAKPCELHQFIGGAIHIGARVQDDD